MNGSSRDAAHAVVARLRAVPGRDGSGRDGSGRDESVPAWCLDRGEVADRLDQLVDEPGRLGQGRLNLCGPALLFKLWLQRDPVAAVTFACDLFDHGAGAVGPLAVRPSAALLRHEYGRSARPTRCHPADWMLMAAVRDATNRIWNYHREQGPGEAMAAITLPGALRRWLLATGVYTAVRDETRLVLGRGVRHALSLEPAADRDVFLLVASEMFARGATLPVRLRRFVVSLAPNHWIQLTSPVAEAPTGVLAFRYWSWGADQPPLVIDRGTFRRCYYGSLTAVVG